MVSTRTFLLGLPVVSGIFLMFLIGCDKPLELEPNDNVPAITLEKRTENGLSVLTWSPIDHPGFEKYWVLRVPDDSTILSDSLEFLNLQVLFHTEDPSTTEYTDDRPILSEGAYYQVYADVNGRLVSSNTVKSDHVVYSMEGLLRSNLITGGAGAIYFAVRDLENGRFHLKRYDLDRRQVDRTVEIETLSSRSSIAFGDFGAGNEIALNNGSSYIRFYDPVTLEFTHVENHFAIAEYLAALPGNRLGVVSQSATYINSFSRASNSWGTGLTLSGQAGVGSRSTLKRIPGTREMILSVIPNGVYRVSFEQDNRFSEQAAIAFTPSTITNVLAIDPQGEYFLPSRTGEVLEIQSFNEVGKVQVDSIGLGNRNWEFTSSGEEIIATSNTFPSIVSLFDRHTFSLLYQETVPAQYLVETYFSMEGKNYMVIRKNEQPFSMIVSHLP